jgi:hypothetical protein
MAQQAVQPGQQNGNPLQHTRKMSAVLEDVRDHLRADIRQIDEPQFKAMFETAAEVLDGLVTAFHRYEAKNESAWKQQ